MSARIGVIGCGWWATRAHLPALRAHPDAAIAAIADPAAENRDRAAGEFGVAMEHSFADVATMLDEVELDGVIVAVPHAAHASVATATLGHDLHTLLEKPMTIRPDDARALTALAQERGVELIIGYPWHYNAHARIVRDALRDGAIGTIEFLACHYAALGRELFRGEPERYRAALGFPLNAPGQRTYADIDIAGGGQGQTQTTHVVALICWLTALRPLEVSAMTSSFELDVDVVDALSVRFEGGAIASVGTTGTLLPGQTEHMELRIYGSAGNITLDLNAGTLVIAGSDGSVTRAGPLQPNERSPEQAPAGNLVDIILGRGANESPASVGLTTVELIDGMYRAATSGRSIAIGRAET